MDLNSLKFDVLIIYEMCFVRLGKYTSSTIDMKRVWIPSIIISSTLISIRKRCEYGEIITLYEYIHINSNLDLKRFYWIYESLILKSSPTISLHFASEQIRRNMLQDIRKSGTLFEYFSLLISWLIHLFVAGYAYYTSMK